MPLTTSHHKYPPMAKGITTAPLVSVSLAKLEERNVQESEAFFEASKNLGFFYLDMEGSALGEEIVAGAEKLHALQQRFFKIPNAEKDEYAREKLDPFFGYRHGKLDTRDENGEFHRNETYNIRKDDIIGNCTPLPAPSLIKESWPLLQSYTRNCRAAIDLMITHLEAHLQIPLGTIAAMHRITSRSGDHVRFNRKAVQPFSPEEAKAGEHTDFGTLTVLFNWIAGLQIRLPESGEWVYVQPVPGSAVVNLGDALVKFTAGLVRSNVHRVVAPPAPQDEMERHSLVYFSRPEDAMVLRRLKGGIIDKQPVTDTDEPEMTSEEWILRRSVGDLRGVYTHKGGLEARPQALNGYV